MTTTPALDRAIEAAGSQIKLCRYLGKPQSSIWTWYNTRGKGPSPDAVPALIAVTKGDCTAVDYRPDIYGWMQRLEEYLAPNVPQEAAIAGFDLLWHQTPEIEAVQVLMDRRGWSRKKARQAVDYLTDNDLHWLHNSADSEGVA